MYEGILGEVRWVIYMANTEQDRGEDGDNGVYDM